MGDGESVRKNGPMVLLVAVLTFLGVRSFTPDSAPPSRTRAETQEEPRARQEQDDNGAAANHSTNDTKRFWQPLVEYYDTKVDSKLAKEIDDNQLEMYRNDVRCLIACVPDPIDSTSAYRFDGLIDAIQRAAERQDFVLDRYFYPWPRRMKHAPVEAAVKELGQLLKYPPRSDNAKHQPGVLLLRNDKPDAPYRLLLLFLVGETATAGLDKKAFAACLPFVKRSEEYQDSKTIRILGPHFTGSQSSLEQSIRASVERKAEENPTFLVISGNAAGIVKRKLCRCAPPATVKFHATVAPAVSVFAALLEHLHLGRRLPKGKFDYKDNFAVLCESNTAFGQGMVEKGALKGSGVGPTYFPFPLHISNMRSAYNKTVGITRQTTLQLPSFGSKLSMPADDGNYPRDVEPALNPPWTAVTAERLLNQTLETISREHFRYVFIVATDMRDQLFLAHLIRQHCHESRLVFTDSDLLFNHPDISADLRGSLVGSSYPLYSGNQRWSFPFRGAEWRFFFPGLGEQGYYNATIALLKPEDSENLVEYGPPFPGSSSERRPPVWISIIGQGGLSPLRAVPILEDEFRDYVHQAPLPSNPSNAKERKGEFVPSYFGSWIMAVLGMSVLLIYVGLSYGSVVRQRASGPEKKRDGNSWDMSHLFRAHRDSHCLPQQRCYVSVCLASGFLVYGYLTFICLIPVMVYCLVGGENSPVKMHGGSMFVSLILAILLLPALFYYIWEWRGIVCLLIAFLFVVLINSSICEDNPANAWQTGEKLLFFERATHLASGITPVAPIFMLGMAYFGWAYFQLKRLFLLDKYYVNKPFPSEKPLLNFDEINRYDEEIGNWLKSPLKVVKRGSAGIALIVLLFLFSRLYVHFVPSIEGTVFDVLLWLALIFLSVLIVHGWLYLRKVWESIRQLLHAITLLPLEEAFANIPSAVTSMFGPNLTSERPGRRGHLYYQRTQHLLLMKEYAQVSHVLLKATCPTALLTALKKAIPTDLLTEVEKTMKPCPEDARPDSDRLTATARACLQLLHVIWDDPNLTARFLSKSTDEAAQATPSEDKPSIGITKKVHTELQGNSPVTAIKEKIEPKDADATDKAVRKWLARVQGFVVLEVTYYLSQFFVQLRNMALFLTITPLLMLFAVTSYPFQPQRLWMWFAVVLTAVATLSVIWLAIQVERNELVSRIVKTTPNEINFHWNFLFHLALYAVPLLGILTAMSSGMSDLVHSLLDPLLQALR